MASAAAERGPGAVHIGLECGPVVERDGDVFGRTVNLAARIAAGAEPGELLSGPRAADALKGDSRYTTAARGERDLKGFAAPVPVWRIQPSGSS
jgi:adenylate cyclase